MTTPHSTARQVIQAEMSDGDEPMALALPAGFPPMRDVIRPLKPGHPVFLVRSPHGPEVLKLPAPTRNPVRRLGIRLLGSLRIRKEAQIYSALQQRQWRWLHFPHLVATDRRHFLLCGYVDQSRCVIASKLSADLVIPALVELQTSGIRLRYPMDERILRYVRAACGGTVLRAALNVRRQCGWRACAGFLQALLTEFMQQRPVRRSWLVHGDLNRKNVMQNDAGQVHFIDYSEAREEHRWLFGDIARYATCKRGALVDTAAVATYVRQIAPRLSEDGIDPALQLRVALLLEVGWLLGSDLRPAAEKAAYADFLVSVLLPRAPYMAWFREHITKAGAVR
jgi:hypothetical protein